MTGASGSGLPIKEEQSVCRRRRPTDSPPVVKKKVRQHVDLTRNQRIATAKSYTGTQQFAPIHTSLKVLAITPGHIILGRTEELFAQADAMDNEVLTTLLDKANQVGKYLERSGVMGEECIYLHRPQ
jgi:hypothetical protein